MISMILLLLLAILGSPSTSFAECQRMYTYSYRGSPYDAIQIHVPAAGSTRGTIRISHDVSSFTEFCGAESEYFCFAWFAVPKRFDGSMRKWTVQDQSFEVVAENQVIQILGRRLEGVFVIKAMPPATYREFLFSPRYGLIGITIGTTTVWLAEESGFGASETGPAAYPNRYRSWNLCPSSVPVQ